ncbi:hypothetical protein ABZ896_22525 [Streptomyces sp. NPDC047072]|uniref:hypothetical protein n=1 Tax=Streptomyces sp. NPDC047072 TaxID=3154809 RepID=UPI0033DC2BA1
MTAPAPVPAQERRHRAAAAFGCTTGDLAAGLLRFAGLPQPPQPTDGPAGTALSMALDLVAEEPHLPDWLELARIWMWHARLHPLTDVEVLAPPARSVLQQLGQYAQDMDGETLRGATLALVPDGWLLEVLTDAVEAHAAGPDTEPPAHAVQDAARDAALQTAAEHELEALRNDPPSTWGRAAWTAMRAALVGRLAYLSSVFAEVAGLPQAPPLTWQETGPGYWRAVEILPGATAPVVVTAQENPAPTDDTDASPNLSVFGPVHWNVTWDALDASTATYEAGNTSGLAFAQWHAHQHVQRLRQSPGGARRGGRLLIPVDPSAPAPAVVPVWHLGLGHVLNSVISRWEDDLLAPSLVGGLWVSQPHSLPDGAPASAAAVLLHDLEAPCPTATEPANSAAVDDPLFAGFLAAHAVCLTPAARAYLAGLADCGPGPTTFPHRHTTAMRAVLALLLAPAHAAAVAAEIGPPPADGGYQTLLDPHRLADHLRLHTRDDEPPDGLDPTQLAAVRQDICDGLAAVARLYMRRDLLRKHTPYEDLKDVALDVIAQRNTFPDPDSEPAGPGPYDHLLPDPPLAFAVSFCTMEEYYETGFTHTTAEPGPAALTLNITTGWGRKVAAPGWAVLARRPVLDILRTDGQGRPDVLRILDLDATSRSSATNPVWHLGAYCPIVNVDWSSGRPHLYMPQPAQER